MLINIYKIKPCQITVKENTMGETSIAIGVKSGALAAIITYMMADTNMVIVLIVGVIGGVAGYYKELVHLEIHSTLQKKISEFFVTTFAAISLALLVAEIGGNFYPMKYGWIGVSFIVAMHSKAVLGTIAPMADRIANGATDVLISIFKKKG